MMKRIMIIFLSLVLVAPAFSQEEKKGFFNGLNYSIETGAAAGSFMPRTSSSYLNLGIKFNVTASYAFNPHLALGLGAGLHLLDQQTSYYYGYKKLSPAAVTGFRIDYPLVPVFFDLKYSVLERKVSPFISCRAGYAFYPKRTETIPYGSSSTEYRYYDGGILLNPVVGIEIELTDKKISQLHVGFGYDFHNVTTANRVIRTYDDGSTSRRMDTYDHHLHSISLNFGISF